MTITVTVRVHVSRGLIGYGYIGLELGEDLG